MTINGTVENNDTILWSKINDPYHFNNEGALVMNVNEDNSQYDYAQGLGFVDECPCIDKMTREELQETYVALDNEYLDLCNDYEDLHLDFLELDAECAQLRWELAVAQRNSL